LAQAIIDRVLERGRLLRLDGPSVRTLHVNLDEAMKEDSDQQTEVARISGKQWPEFPEPTTSIVCNQYGFSAGYRLMPCKRGAFPSFAVTKRTATIHPKVCGCPLAPGSDRTRFYPRSALAAWVKCTGRVTRS